MKNLIDDLVGIALILAVFAGAGALLAHALTHESEVVAKAMASAKAQAYVSIVDEDMSPEDIAMYEAVEVGDE